MPHNCPSQPQAAANVFPVSLDFPVLGISYIWKSCTIWGCGTSFFHECGVLELRGLVIK